MHLDKTMDYKYYIQTTDLSNIVTLVSMKPTYVLNPSAGSIKTPPKVVLDVQLSGLKNLETLGNKKIADTPVSSKIVSNHLASREKNIPKRLA